MYWFHYHFSNIRFKQSRTQDNDSYIYVAPVVFFSVRSPPNLAPEGGGEGPIASAEAVH